MFGLDISTWIPYDMPIFLILVISLVILSFTKIYRYLLCAIISYYPAVVFHQAVPWGDIGSNLRIIVFFVILVAVFFGMHKVLGDLPINFGPTGRAVDAVAIGIGAACITVLILDKVFQLKNVLEIPAGTQTFLVSNVGSAVLVAVPLLVFLMIARRG
jgi:hypothetical protein